MKKNNSALQKQAFLWLHFGRVLRWAYTENSSKRIVAALIQENLKIDVSPDQVYRFVKIINGGSWPNSKNGASK